MPVHMFPSIEKYYTTPRGRQTLCEQRSPDFTHNDTIKRIQTSKQNTEFLKKLANKQVKKLTQQDQSKKPVNDDVETANKLNINKFKQKRQQQRRHSLGKLKSVEHLKRQHQQFPLKSGCGVIRLFSTKTTDLSGTCHDCNIDNVGAATLKYYLQLATDYYQQGFLQNIKYLENLGERNRRRRERRLQLHQQQQQQQLQQQNNSTFTFGGLSNSNNTNRNSLKLKSIRVATERITDALLKQNSCDIIKQQQQQINQDNPILCRQQQQIDKLTINELPLDSNKNRRNCAIRVNIKPQTANTSQRENFLGANQEIYGKNRNIHESKDFSSMNDYLNGNLVYTQLQQQQQQQQQEHHIQQPQTHFHNFNSVNNHNYTSVALPIDALIDNLRELDIQENRTNLPRITLTDYTQKYPNELDSDGPIPHTSQARIKKRLSSCVIKQSSLDYSNLDIPRETNYHSEARPP